MDFSIPLRLVTQGTKDWIANHPISGCTNSSPQEMKVEENDKDYVLKNSFHFHSVKLICQFSHLTWEEIVCMDFFDKFLSIWESTIQHYAVLNTLPWAEPWRNSMIFSINKFFIYCAIQLWMRISIYIVFHGHFKEKVYSTSRTVIMGQFCHIVIRTTLSHKNNLEGGDFSLENSN